MLREGFFLERNDAFLGKLLGVPPFLPVQLVGQGTNKGQEEKGSGFRGSLCSAGCAHRPSSTWVLRARRLPATGAQTNPSIPHASTCYFFPFRTLLLNEIKTVKSTIRIISSVLLLEAANYFYSSGLSQNADQFYSLTARYSARITFFLLVSLAIWIVLKGLHALMDSSKSREVLLAGLTAVAVNHLIHFYFLYQNFQVNGLDLWTKAVSFGALAYVFLSLAPIYFWTIKRLGSKQYALIHFFVMLLLAICVFTYSSRLGRVEPLPLSPPIWQFKFFIGIGLSAIAALLARILVDSRSAQD